MLLRIFVTLLTGSTLAFICLTGKGSLGACIAKMGKRDSVRVSRAVAEDRVNLEFRYLSGSCNYQQGKFEAAAKDLSIVVAEDTAGKFPDAAFLLGKSYYEIQDLRQAKISFEESVKRGYKKGQAYYYIGDCYAQMEQDTYALAAFKNVLKEPGSDAKEMALFRVAELYYELGEHMRDRKTANRILRGQAMPAYQKLLHMKGEHAKDAQDRLQVVKILLAQSDS